jgi:hypothetical protein
MFIEDKGGENNSNISFTRLGIMVDSNCSSNGAKIGSAGTFGPNTNTRKIDD